MLLADGLITFGGRVKDVDADGVEFVVKIAGDVEGEGVVAAGVLADLLVVHEDGGLPVNSAKVQQNSAAFPGFGEAEGAGVPDAIFGADGFHHAGEGGFDGIGDEDLALEFLGEAFGVAGDDGIIPQAVEVDPFRPLHLRAGIFAQGVVG